jgi:hypothetical protein
VKVIARPSFDQLVASLDQHQAAICAASAGLLETIAYLDETGSWGDDETSLECFLAARYAVSSRTAWGWVRVARALRMLPAIREAYADGHLSWDQLRPLTRFATSETDELLAHEAVGMRVGQLWREARRHERTRKQRERKKDAQLRSLRMEWDEEGRFLHLEGDLPAEQGAAAQATIEARAQEVVLEEDDPPFDRQGAKLADAFVELVTSSADDASPATLVVHTDAEVLSGTPSNGAIVETECGAQLPDESVRRLACDARIEWVLEAHGRAVGIGRRGRVVPGWLGRQLRHRDPECRFDGCDRKRSLIAHHVVHWARGGPTDLDNLVRLCRTHHRLVHEAGWRITGHPDRRLRFHDPGARKRLDKPRSPSRLLAATLR